MKKTIYTLFICMMVTMMTSCSWFETDNAGDLEGLWHLRSVENLSDGTVTDYSKKRIYWAFQKKLLEMQDKDNNTASILWRFAHNDSRLILTQPYRYDRENGDEPLESTELLLPYFIDNLEEEFYIDHLGSGTMLLTSPTVRMSFRKF